MTIETPLNGLVDLPSDPLHSSSDSWDVLDRFIQELQSSDRTTRQFKLLLQTISDSLKADAVFLYTACPDDAMEIIGPFVLTTAWCRTFAEGILHNLPANTTHLVQSNLSQQGPERSPTSVAMIQVSKSKKAWAVALTFTPERVFHRSDLKFMLLARRMLSYHYQQMYTSDELKNALLGLVFCLTASIEAKDPYTCGHSERVARIAVRLSQQMKLPETLVSDIYLSGLLHDIGKIGIKDSVLQKPGKLTEEEMLHVQEHPVIGDRIISNVKKLSHLRPGVRNHHERYDGQGYPDGLVGDAIPLMARVLAVADACDAMMSPRPYRSAMPPWQIDAIMTQGSGTQWDPQIIQHFTVCRKELYSICQRGIGESVYVAVERAVRAGNKPSWTHSQVVSNGPSHTRAGN